MAETENKVETEKEAVAEASVLTSRRSERRMLLQA